MTDGRKNPDETSEEDWAMSESESDLKEQDLEIEQQSEDVNENVSSLYDPLDTGDLEGWDISAEDAAPVDYEPSVDQPPQENDPFIDSFRTPGNTIEIIKPEKPTVNQESWEVKSPPPQDEWQMPQPVFRSSEGKTILNVSEKSSVQAAAANQVPEVDEKLSHIYAPPDTVEVINEDPEDNEISSLDDEDFETDDFEDISEPETVYEEDLKEVPVKKAKGKTFAVLAIGFLLISLILLGILGVAYFYYFDTLNAIFGN
jgi:hypothetical protein